MTGIGLIHLLDAIGKYNETRHLFWSYILSRTTGLPNATGDIGNWSEPLGLASLFVEGAVIAVAAGAYTIVPPRMQMNAGLRSLPTAANAA